MRARFVKDYPPANHIHWRLYQCEPGGLLPEYVIVSASNVGPMAMRESGLALLGDLPGLQPETRVYAADYLGRIENYSEWIWEERGTLDHEQALRAAGYEPT